MYSKRQALHLALLLTMANDGDLLQENNLLASENLAPDDVERIKEIGRIVEALYQDYAYIQSPVFSAEIAGKSASLIAMKIKMESVPLRRKERRETLATLIGQALDDTTTLRQWVREDQQPLVTRLGDLLNALTLPEG